MAIEKELLDQLLAGRDPNEVFAKDGLLDDLKKALSERILNAELDEHLEDENTEGNANRRNGHSRKSVLTGTSKMTLTIPRDRAGTFNPKLIAKYQRRFPDFDDKIIFMYARGMTVREIRGHLEELYGIDVSPDRRHDRLAILPRHELQGMADQMHDAGLDHGLGEDGVDRLGEALQAVDDGDQDVGDAENLLRAVRQDAERDVDGLVAYLGRHRRRPGGSGRVAERAAGCGLSAGLLRCHPGQIRDEGFVHLDRADRGRQVLAACHERAEEPWHAARDLPGKGRRSRHEGPGGLRGRLLGRRSPRTGGATGNTWCRSSPSPKACAGSSTPRTRSRR